MIGCERMIESWKTAIRRNKLSKPVQMYKHELNGKILNYGSGLGEDTDFLKLEGYDVYNYDKYFQSNANLTIKYDTIICNYILNVIPTENERLLVLSHIKSLLVADGFFYITVRCKSEKNSIKTGVKYNDGILTSKNTFQRFFDKEELIKLVGYQFKDVKLLAKNPLIIKVGRG
jgi:DNA phosphorothioation-associated putative methyltransferase